MLEGIFVKVYTKSECSQGIRKETGSALHVENVTAAVYFILFTADSSFLSVLNKVN